MDENVAQGNEAKLKIFQGTRRKVYVVRQVIAGASVPRSSVEIGAQVQAPATWHRRYLQVCTANVMIPIPTEQELPADCHDLPAGHGP